MAISVVTLNIEGDRHFDRFLPVIQKMQPDVVCLQEVFKVDLPRIAEALGFVESQFAFMPMTSIDEENQYDISPRGEWGIALLTRLEHSSFTTLVYKGTGTVPKFTTPNSVNRGLLLTQQAGTCVHAELREIILPRVMRRDLWVCSRRGRAFFGPRTPVPCLVRKEPSVQATARAASDR